jgi:hypothetical protein
MGFFDRLLKKGELPEVKTSVEIDNASLVKMSIAIVVVAVIIIAVNKLVKKA